jgi:hypothetical protein
MDTTAHILSRLQFAFTISFHIIFPAFTIGLAAWLTILEALHLTTGSPAYRVLPVRHELERAVQDVRTDSGAPPLIRDIHGLCVGSQFFWRPPFWPVSRTPVVLSVLDRDGGVGDDAFGVLDHGQ